MIVACAVTVEKARAVLVSWSFHVSGLFYLTNPSNYSISANLSYDMFSPDTDDFVQKGDHIPSVFMENGGEFPACEYCVYYINSPSRASIIDLTPPRMLLMDCLTAPRNECESL